MSNNQQVEEEAAPTIISTVDATLDSGPFGLLLAAATLYSLFGEDVRLALTDHPADGAFYITTCVVIALFLIEMIMRSVAKDDYLWPTPLTQPVSSTGPTSSEEETLARLPTTAAAPVNAQVAALMEEEDIPTEFTARMFFFFQRGMASAGQFFKWLPAAIIEQAWITARYIYHAASFHFWLDALAVASLALDIVIIRQDMDEMGGSILLSHDGSTRTAFISFARAGRASRAGARAGRLLRLFRILRRMWQVSKAPPRRLSGDVGTGVSNRDRSRTSSATTGALAVGLDGVHDPSGRPTSMTLSSGSDAGGTSLPGKPEPGRAPSCGGRADCLRVFQRFQSQYERARNDVLAETRVGARLTEVMTRGVILGVLLLVVIIPVCTFSPVDNARHFAAESIHTFGLLSTIDNATYVPVLQLSIEGMLRQQANSEAAWRPAAASLNGSALSNVLPSFSSEQWARRLLPDTSIRRSTLLELTCHSTIWRTANDNALAMAPPLGLQLCSRHSVTVVGLDPSTGLPRPGAVPVPYMTTLWIDMTEAQRQESTSNAFFTLVILFTIAFGSTLFIVATNRLVLQPVEKLVLVVQRLTAKPLAPMSELLEGTGQTGTAARALFDTRGLSLGLQPSTSGKKPLTAREMALASGGTEATETRLLLNALLNMGPLLRLGFGDAGAGAVIRSLNQNGEIQPTDPGRLTYGLILHVRVKHIQDFVERALAGRHKHPRDRTESTVSPRSGGRRRNSARFREANFTSDPRSDHTEDVPIYRSDTYNSTSLGHSAHPTAEAETLAEEATLIVNGVMAVVHGVGASFGARISSCTAEGTTLHWVLPKPSATAAMPDNGLTPWTCIADTALLAVYQMQIELARMSPDLIGVPIVQHTGAANSQHSSGGAGTRASQKSRDVQTPGGEADEDDVHIVVPKSPTQTGVRFTGIEPAASAREDIAWGELKLKIEIETPNDANAAGNPKVGTKLNEARAQSANATALDNARPWPDNKPRRVSGGMSRLSTRFLFSGGKAKAVWGGPRGTNLPDAPTSPRVRSDDGDPQPRHLLSLHARSLLHEILHEEWRHHHQERDDDLPSPRGAGNTAGSSDWRVARSNDSGAGGSSDTAATAASSSASSHWTRGANSSAGLTFTPDASSLISACLHAGWLVEGVSGSDKQLDAGLYGPHSIRAQHLCKVADEGRRGVAVGSTGRAVHARTVHGYARHAQPMLSSAQQAAEATLRPCTPQPQAIPLASIIVTHPVVALLSSPARDKLMIVDVVRCVDGVSISGEGMPIGFEPWAIPSLCLDPDQRPIVDPVYRRWEGTDDVDLLGVNHTWADQYRMLSMGQRCRDTWYGPIALYSAQVTAGLTAACILAAAHMACPTSMGSLSLPTAARLSTIMQVLSDERPRLPDPGQYWPTVDGLKDTVVSPQRKLASSRALGKSQRGSVSRSGVAHVPVDGTAWLRWDAQQAWAPPASHTGSTGKYGISLEVKEAMYLATFCCAGSVQARACMSQAVKLLLPMFGSASLDGYDAKMDSTESKRALQAVDEWCPLAKALVTKCLTGALATQRRHSLPGVPDPVLLSASFLLGIAWTVHGVGDAAALLARIAQEKLPHVSVLPAIITVLGHPSGVTQKQALVDSADVSLEDGRVLRTRAPESARREPTWD